MVRTARPRPVRAVYVSSAGPGLPCASGTCSMQPRWDVRVSTEHDLGVGCEQILVGARIGRPQLRELRQHALRNRHVRLLALPPGLGVAWARRKEAWVEDDVVVVAYHDAHVSVVDGRLATERRRWQGVGGSILFAHLGSTHAFAKRAKGGGEERNNLGICIPARAHLDLIHSHTS